MPVVQKKKNKPGRGSYCVYVHINKITQEAYVGITNDTKSRWGKEGSGYKECPKFYQAIKLYGWNNFYHIILLDNISKKMAQEKEKYYIDQFNSIEHGYNLRRG